MECHARFALEEPAHIDIEFEKVPVVTSSASTDAPFDSLGRVGDLEETALDDDEFDLSGYYLFEDEHTHHHDVKEQQELVPVADSSVVERPILEFVFGSSRFSIPPETANCISGRLWSSAVLGCACLSGDLQAQRCLVPRDTQVDVSVVDLEVLEVGCGLGLTGMAASALGAKRVTFTDCDDRALTALGAHLLTAPVHHLGRLAVSEERAMADESPWWRVCHQLWEDELIGIDSENENLDYPPVHAGSNHWSCAHRDAGSPFAASLGCDEKFDVVIASDCLYFASQERPLVDLLRRRLRRQPHAFALVVAVQRANGGFHVERFKEMLVNNRFVVEHGEICEFDYAAMLERRLAPECLSAVDLRDQVVHTRNEMSCHVIVARWASGAGVC
eukprot:SRR837773.8701.p1 GENE.SRR837773.8701~~SRR837773.8701.p1  ORF type:complete len:389 (+),score=29.20 SRR837773.8701:41-1207(+)